MLQNLIKQIGTHLLFLVHTLHNLLTLFSYQCTGAMNITGSQLSAQLG